MSKIIKADINDEMKRSYLDYAMSVIVSRALPDVRDGLKPVHRRIIFTMHKLGLSVHARYSKSAKIVGEVLGKYHPHGDSAVYEALVRMAQDFSMRNPLIRGQGNFGSIDGDPPAAMRYTEVKLEKIAHELLADISKDTVEFRENFDSTLEEPVYLPCRIPNLLVNGSEGIAVGMATKIPPHNLSELLEALQHMLAQANFEEKFKLDKAAETVSFNVDVPELMKYIKGPDFPTGGIIYSKKDIEQAYLTGRQSLLMRGVAEIQENKKGRQAIIITELPYQVNKANLVKRIAQLAQAKAIKGIADLRDESSRKQIRIVIELRRDTNPNRILNNLYLKTPLQTNFPVNIVTLVDGVPQTLSLKSILEFFIRHRCKVIIRRSRFELKQAEHDAHILEGLLIAIENIDEIVALIKKASSEADAKAKLIKRFKLSPIQAQAILDMQLKKLTGLEKNKIEAALAELKIEIERLKKILASLTNILLEIKKELKELIEKYPTKRLTKIITARPGEFSEEELIEQKDTYILLTKKGYVKQLSKGVFKVQHRGGKGVIGIATTEDDQVLKLEHCQTHDELLFFTNRGRVFKLRAWEVPESSRQSKGKAIVNLLNLGAKEHVTTFFPMQQETKELKQQYFFFITKRGVVKKTSLASFQNIRTNGLIAIKLVAEDELVQVELVQKDDLIFLVSSGGKAITFSSKNVRPTGRSAIGVRGIRLKKQEQVTSLSVISLSNLKKSRLIIVTKKGYGKLVRATNFRIQNRGGMGVKAANITEKTEHIVFSELVHQDDRQLVLTSVQGQIVKSPLKAIPTLSRNTQGVILMRFSAKSDYIASATLI